MEVDKYKRLLINASLFLLNAVATKLITFLLVPLYTYYMSAGEYGLTDMSVTVINLMTPLATLSVAEAAVRFLVADRCRQSEYAAMAFAVTLLSIPLVAIVTPLFDLQAFGGLGDYKGWFVAAYAASAVLNLCGEIARGLGEIRLIPICAGVSSGATLLLAFLLIGGLGMGITGYFISVSFGPLFAVSIYLTAGELGATVMRGLSRLAALPKGELRGLAAPMFLYTIPLIPNNLFWWLSSGINRLFVTGLIGIAASGMFAAASKIPNLLNSVYSIFQQAWQLSAYQESESEGLDRFFSSVFCLLQAVLTILCSLLSAFAAPIASLLLQGETYGAWPMIPVLLISNLFNVFSSFYGTVYSTTMHTSIVLRTTVLGAVSCVMLTPLLIPSCGIMGACIASAVGQTMVFASRLLNAKRFIRIELGWHYFIPTISLLVVQAAVAMSQAGGWQIISYACAVGVFAIQGIRVVRLIRMKA